MRCMLINFRYFFTSDNQHPRFYTTKRDFISMMHEQALALSDCQANDADAAK